jgi:hypothetical protein
MKTTVLNPENPRRRRRVKRRHVRRRNVAAAVNPRRRRHYRRRHYRNAAVALNPRRRRHYGRRRNPVNPELNLSRILYATGGGALTRFGMRKLAGKRVTEGGERKLDTMHYVAALGAIYFGPDIAEAIGGTPEESRAFADGAAAVAGQFLIDQHLRDFSAGNLMPFDSPTPTGTDLAGIAGGRGIGAGAGLGTTRSNPMPYNRYMQLAGIGQLPPGGVYVRGQDGSVWWFPGRRAAGARAAMAGIGAGNGNGRMRELPDHIPVGAIVRDTDTGERFLVGMDRGSQILVPVKSGMGATAGEYFGLVAAR